MIADKEKLLEELYKKYPIGDEVSFNEFNIQEKLQKIGYLTIQYRDLYMRAKIDLEELASLRERMVGEIYNRLRFEDERSLTKSEIEKYYIPLDENLIKLEKKIARINVKYLFFESCYKTLEKMSWSMKNYIETTKVNFA